MVHGHGHARARSRTRVIYEDKKCPRGSIFDLLYGWVGLKIPKTETALRGGG
jgi:hypothetical protein